MLFRTKLFTRHSVKDQKRQLILALSLFVFVLSIPLGILVQKGYEQFQKDVYFYYLWNAKHVVKNINADHDMHFEIENRRSIDDYQFYKAREDVGDYEQGITLSPLAGVPEHSPVPGLVSYFQIDESGSYSCPLLPFTGDTDPNASSGSVEHLLSKKQIDKRLALRKKIQPILENAGLFTSGVSGSESETEAHLEQDTYELEATPVETQLPADIKKISSLKSARNEQGYLILFRDIWNGEDKLVQGLVVNERKFIFKAVKNNFASSEFKTDVLLKIKHKGTTVASLLHDVGHHDTREIKFVQNDIQDKSIAIHEFKLEGPLKDYTLAFSTNTLPLGDATKTGGFFLIIVIIVIVVGLFIFYRLGIQQINLNAERLNFVSSVSHELKTPLTSIIMYADMLRSGMQTDHEKCRDYYNFIFFEGERLGRLISNVLKLSKLGQDSEDIKLEYTTISAALDILKSKTSSVVEKNGFTLNINFASDVNPNNDLLIDRDAFTQISINLIDNAVKFTSEYLERLDSVNDEKNTKNNRVIDVNVGLDNVNPSLLNLGVRDYGPGIAKADSKHIFKSFYRAGNELTRKTTGTGMGLSLVKELAIAMDGDVTFRNRDPGAEFIVSLQYNASSKS